MCPWSRPVENFGSDLQDGIALSKLLTVIAPEASMVGERLDAAPPFRVFGLPSKTSPTEG